MKLNIYEYELLNSQFHGKKGQLTSRSVTKSYD